MTVGKESWLGSAEEAAGWRGRVVAGRAEEEVEAKEEVMFGVGVGWQLAAVSCLDLYVSTSVKRAQKCSARTFASWRSSRRSRGSAGGRSCRDRPPPARDSTPSTRRGSTPAGVERVRCRYSGSLPHRAPRCRQPARFAPCRAVRDHRDLVQEPQRLQDAVNRKKQLRSQHRRRSATAFDLPR